MVAEDQHLVLVGTAEQDLAICQGAVGGLLSGPQLGDLGDWQATATALGQGGDSAVGASVATEETEEEEATRSGGETITGPAPAGTVKPAAGLPAGTMAPTFGLPDVNGETFTLDRLRARGKPVVLLSTDPKCVRAGRCSRR